MTFPDRVRVTLKPAVLQQYQHVGVRSTGSAPAGAFSRTASRPWYQPQPRLTYHSAKTPHWQERTRDISPDSYVKSRRSQGP